MNARFFEAVMEMPAELIESVERTGGWLRPKIAGAHNVSDVPQCDFALRAKIRENEPEAVIALAEKLWKQHIREGR
jgi:hypothetical protein